jgi:hypothetical protein
VMRNGSFIVGAANSGRWWTRGERRGKGEEMGGQADETTDEKRGDDVPGDPRSLARRQDE